MTKDFPLSAEGLLAKQWNTEKNDIDLAIATKKIDLVTAAETEYLEDPEMNEKIKARAEEKQKKEEAKAKELAGKFKDDLAKQEAKLAQEAQEAEGTPKGDAIKAIKEYYGSAKEYLGVLGSVSAELTDEEKDAVVAARKKYNAAKDGFTAAKLKKTGDYTEEEAQDEITSMTGSVEAAVKKFKDVVAKAEGDAEEKKNKIKEKIADLKEELKTAKQDLEAAKVSADEPKEEDPAVIAAKQKIEDIEGKIREQEELLEDSVQVEETEDLEEGNEFGAARAEAIAKGEKTFKVGDEEYPVEDVSKDDKENAKEFVEEAKKELPKKIKLYEGMSIADKFKALI